MANEKKPFCRLPKAVTPRNYDLTLKPNLDSSTVEGSLAIAVQVHQETKFVTLNSVDIVINDDQTLFVKVGDKTISHEAISYSVPDETVTVTFKESLPVGEAVLNLKFSGIIQSSLRGFYKAKSGEATAMTQMAPTDARRAFPCFDEPALKASFDITLIVPTDPKIKALSNMDVLEEKVVNGFREVRFSRTPIMSSYLVAYAIGQFDRIESKTTDGVKVGIYTPVGKAEQGRFALDVAVKSLDFYREYFGIPYPLNKCDLIAYPDLSYGAMENWGLVSYRQNRLLVDSNNSSTATKQSTALVIAHELAHQWFGNLVTMEWWTHLWLNEGFANFMEYLCIDKLFPEYNIGKLFVCYEFLRALQLDGLDSSHPIEVPVGHPAEIDEIFDAISYAKGASVIRMLYHYIGDEAFRKGMNLYLTKHSYSNTETEDLWDALEEASKLPVKSIMRSWTSQKGYPVVTVSVKEKKDNSQTISLHQKKFNQSGTLSEDDKKYLWSVPLSIVSQSSPQNKVPLSSTLFNTRELTLSSSVELLKFVNAFKDEKDYTVWFCLSSILRKYNQLLAGTTIHEKYRQWAKELINNGIGLYISWEAKTDEPHLEKLLRSTVISLLVNLEDEKTLEHCVKLLKEQLDGGAAISADLRETVYRGAAMKADVTVFEKLIKIYEESDLQEEKLRAIVALGSVKQEQRITDILQYSISDKVRFQDCVNLIESLAANSAAREEVWKFLTANKSKFIEMQKQSGILFSRAVKAMLHNFSCHQRANEVDSFFRSNPFDGSEVRSVSQAVETIHINADVLARDLKSLTDFFQEL
ncbi:PREDICTED: puromycin-sensitive aminopeptidase-like protein [Rhagoletis zephyria]|uniref:puromycin-sensitive aminopeptidase-like protein n=1 Tax=Rhagoletis zephyria TaxID=28612 RepID=UPI0008115F79|nr:PREDICTED: puromycin-sensitive aminopeptidase-like protein [Rhagoletis zephyria]